MSAIKTGKHVRVRDTKKRPASRILATHPYLEKDRAYLVKTVQEWTGLRRRVFFEVPGREDLACLYSADLAALPRCLVCDSENHKTPKVDSKTGDPRPCPKEAEVAA